MQEYLEVAKSLALDAGALMKGYFAMGVKHTFKDDHTPLTEADERIHALVIERLSAAFPEHSLYGEEGQVMKDSRYVWVFDPIDGTAPFLRGVPTNVFALALVEDGEPIVGVVYDPHLNRLYAAAKGEGATLNGAKITTSSHPELSRSYIEVDGYRGFKDLTFLDRAHAEGIRFLSYSSTVYAQMLVATGQLQGVVFPLGNPWDAAAAKIIVEEAGGVTSDLHGSAQRYDRETKGIVSAGNPEFHEKLLALIAPSV